MSISIIALIGRSPSINRAMSWAWMGAKLGLGCAVAKEPIVWGTALFAQTADNNANRRLSSVLSCRVNSSTVGALWSHFVLYVAVTDAVQYPKTDRPYCSAHSAASFRETLGPSGLPCPKPPHKTLEINTHRRKKSLISRAHKDFTCNHPKNVPHKHLSIHRGKQQQQHILCFSSL